MSSQIPNRGRTTLSSAKERESPFHMLVDNGKEGDSALQVSHLDDRFVPVTLYPGADGVGLRNTDETAIDVADAPSLAHVLADGQFLADVGHQYAVGRVM